VTEEKNILLIDDNEDLLALLESALSKAGYVIFQARNGEDGIRRAAELKPDLIILDIMMPRLDGFEVCRKLKAQRNTARIPVLFLSAKNKVEDKIHGLQAGASDYLSKPFKVKELIARADALIKNYREHIDTNPASRLPGNYSINRELQRLIESGKAFAVGYADLDNFKAFNDKYGFYQGDVLLNITAQVLESNLQKLGDRTDFLGHVGGDDYILVTSTHLIEDICFGIIHDFSRRVREAYPEEDFERGHISVKDRTGFVSLVPITTISIAVVTNKKRKFTHPAQIGQIAAEIKSYLKEMPGSNFKIDQRSSTEMEHKDVHRRKILLVSREKNGIYKARNALEKNGYQVKTAENGAMALVLAEKFLPDLMIIHESLDLVNGTDLYRLLKTDNHLRHIPVIYCGTDIPSYMAERDIFFRVSRLQEMYDITNILPSVEKLVSSEPGRGRPESG
jgi:diguanylate cyclase (GGDEF)-like protein